MPGIDDSIGEAPPEWLNKMFDEYYDTSSINTPSDRISVEEIDPVTQMEKALEYNCPFCNTKSLQRYNIEAGKVRCKSCDIIISIRLVFSKQ